jgi:DNA mismatch endonuclease (patch repair protein)
MLWHSGHRGYRLHYKKVPGRPDISFVSKKLAIFVHGCFWHRCPTCAYTLPKTNRKFWQAKFDRNVARDENKVRELRRLDWKVITVWECELKTNPTKVLRNIVKRLT